MAKVDVREITHDQFGRCIELTNGLVELLVTIDYGPRIMHFATVGMENMFYVDEAKAPLGTAYPAYEGDICRCYGGHRLWISPEVLPRCYYPDNASVTWELCENGAVFTSPVEKVNFIQKTLTVTLMEDAPSATVLHSIENTGHWEVELAPWCLSMMAAGTKAVMPMPNRETGVLANRNFTVWPYASMADARVYWGEDFITLQQNSKNTRAFKFGYNNEAGWAAGFNKGQVFIKFYEPVIDGLYPDNGCSYETYTNEVFLEMETLGEATLLQPQESVQFMEEWELYPESSVPSNDESEIHEIMQQYI